MSDPKPNVRQRALEIARTQLGVKEATGHNDGPDVERYTRGDHVEWCASFVLWCFQQAGRELPGSFWENRAVSRLFSELVRAGAIFTGCAGLDPKPGDLVFFFPLHHIGIVDDANASVVVTIEGNSGDQVARRHYARTDPALLFFARPFPEED